MIVYFLFSSITFLQLYIPLVIELNKLKHTSYFILRLNYKEYANPFSTTNLPIIIKYSQKYNITLIDSRRILLNTIKGLVFMVDGDIYGPPQEISFRESLLTKLNFNVTTRVSLIEHMNYKWAYQHYIKNINYVIFPGKYFMTQIIYKTPDIISNNLNKNLFLGNTKFDNIPTNEIILEKYKLNKDKKYCLILFPKIQFRNNIIESDLLNIYDILKKLNYKIIVKTRPKDNIKPHNINKKFYGDKFVSSDIYPNESIELMKISELCIIFSSSASDETLFCKIPTLDFPVIWNKMGKTERNEFLVNPKLFRRVDNWKNIDKKKLESIINNMEPKLSNKYNPSKYINNLGNASIKILNKFGF